MSENAFHELFESELAFVEVYDEEEIQFDQPLQYDEVDTSNLRLIVSIEEDKLLGVMLVTNYIYETEDNLDIAFKSGEGGSSGGMVLALGIYSKITGIDLLKGRNIAGTGTIDINGNIGEIDGIKYKIAGAVKNKIDVILVSPYNYEEAKKIINENKYKIELVKVNTFKEAIDYLTK